MELLESDDPKSRLIKKSAIHRSALEEEARLISARTEKAITNVLIIGGALAITYVLVRQFSGPKGNSKAHAKKIKGATAAAPEESEEITSQLAIPGIVAQLGTAFASQATAFLLTLAKEKLSEYLQSQIQKKIEKDERP